MVIEHSVFRLRPGADEAAFLEADRRVQTECIATATGFLRRTTARGRDGTWLVATLWDSEVDADAHEATSSSHSARVAFDAAVDAATVHRRRFTTLD